VVGHFVFSKLLIPSLQAAAKTGVTDSVRVVWTSSNGHNFAPKGFINFDDVNLEKGSNWQKYGQSKAVYVFYWHILTSREILS
jgi:retinol dehydrogenase 12